MLCNSCFAILAYFAVCNQFVNSASISTKNLTIITGIQNPPPILVQDNNPFPEETDAQQFKRVDADGNGKISFEEFLKLDLVEQAMKKDEFNDIDTNGDHNLEESEIVSYNAEWRNEERKWNIQLINDTIDEYDTNSDSKLEENELIAYLRYFYMLQPKDNFDKIFKTFDKNGDKGLDGNEMVTFDEHIPYDDLEYADYDDGDSSSWG